MMHGRAELKKHTLYEIITNLVLVLYENEHPVTMKLKRTDVGIVFFWGGGSNLMMTSKFRAKLPRKEGPWSVLRAG
jgi:hypothetical protein